MSRGLLILVVAALLLAAGSRHLFHVPNDQVTANRLAWNDLDETERDLLRVNWRRVRGVSADEQSGLLSRMETLSRLLVVHRRRSDQNMSATDLTAELSGLPQRVSAWLPGPAVANQSASERVSRRTGRLLNRFLENLTAARRLDPSELDRLMALPFSQRVLEGLELQKREEIFYLSETPGSRDLDELDQLEPLAVMADAWDQRRRRGFLGRAGRSLGLEPSELRGLAEVPDEQLVGALRELLVPKVRRHLEHINVAPARIEVILAKPYRELERALDDLERGER